MALKFDTRFVYFLHLFIILSVLLIFISYMTGLPKNIYVNTTTLFISSFAIFYFLDNILEKVLGV